MSFSCYECLICCDPSIDTSFSIENAATLCRTIIGQFHEPSEFLSNSEDDVDDSIRIPISSSLLFQSATYCPRCVVRIRDLEILFKELEALQVKLEYEKSQIEIQIRQSFEFCGRNRSTVDNRNQKLRKKIVTTLNNARTTDSVNMGNHQIQSTPSVLPDLDLSNLGVLQPQSPAPSIASIDEEKYFPEEELETLTLTGTKVNMEISGGTSEDFIRGTYDESSALASQLKTHKYVFSHYGEPGENETEIIEPSINTKMGGNDKIEGLENNSTTSSSVEADITRDPRSNQKLPVIILHKLTAEETHAALERSRIRNRNTEGKSKKTKTKILQKKRKIATSGTRTSPTSRTVEIETSESNGSGQPNGHKKRRRKWPSDGIPLKRCAFPDCSISFRLDGEIRLKAHVRKFHEGMLNPYLCETENCGQFFISLKALRAHDSWKHKGIFPYVCSHCEEVCTSEHHLKLHIAVNHKPEDIRSKCEFCDQAFVDQRRLKLHLMKHTKERPFMCEICSKTFNTSQVLKYHQSKHHTEMVPFDPYKCNECGKIFAAPKNLRDHLKSQHRKEFKYQCEICGYGTLTPSGLKHHMNYRHSDAKNFKCDQCEASYKAKHQLTVHIRTHTGERPFVCSTESCRKSFTNVGKLKRHELIHSKEQCHECLVCGKTFPVKNYLYIHMRSHNKKLKTK